MSFSFVPVGSIFQFLLLYRQRFFGYSPALFIVFNAPKDISLHIDRVRTGSNRIFEITCVRLVPKCIEHPIVNTNCTMTGFFSKGSAHNPTNQVSLFFGGKPPHWSK